MCSAIFHVRGKRLLVYVVIDSDACNPLRASVASRCGQRFLRDVGSVKPPQEKIVMRGDLPRGNVCKSTGGNCRETRSGICKALGWTGRPSAARGRSSLAHIGFGVCWPRPSNAAHKGSSLTWVSRCRGRCVCLFVMSESRFGGTFRWRFFGSLRVVVDGICLCVSAQARKL